MSYIKDNKIILTEKDIGIDIARRCNLRCEYCNHFSDYKLSDNYLDLDRFTWIENWATKITPKKFWFAGGEPLLNKNWRQYLYLVNDLWGTEITEKLFYTNGLLIENQLDFLSPFKDTSTNIVISLHSKKNKTYLNKLKKNLQFLLKSAKLIRNERIYSIYELEDVKIYLHNVTEKKSEWVPFYRKENNKIKPYDDNNITESFKNCTCPAFTIYENNMFKCAPTAYLKDTLQKLGQLQDKDWESYLKYKGISYTESLENILSFVELKEENICNMCPSNPAFIENKEIY